jgi:transcriptional regulator with XRE-family HTH domain
MPRDDTITMVKKKSADADNEDHMTPTKPLGEFLTNIRSVKKLTLREVEEATNKDVSNAYLSQLETGKITKPSPNVLFALAQVYAVPYEVLMEKAGYIAPSAASNLQVQSQKRHGRVATFANEVLTQEEEESLLEYLAFLRSRRSKGGEKTR